MHKNFENWKILGFFSISVSIWDIFHGGNCNYIFIKAYWTTNLRHVEQFHHFNPRILSKIWLKLHKNYKTWNFFSFLSFSVLILYLFDLENSTYLLIHAYWRTKLCLVERFQHSNPQYLSKIWQNLQWNNENWEFLVFCIFWLKLHKNYKTWDFFSFLSFSVFILYLFDLENSTYLLIHAYWRTKLCLVERFQHSNPQYLSKIWQNLQWNNKNWEFPVFCIFRVNFVSFSHGKQHLSLHRSLLDNKFVPCWAFSTF